MSATRNDNAGPALPRTWRPSLGAWPEGDGTRFRVWAPGASELEVVVEGHGADPQSARLEKSGDGTFGGFLSGVRAGSRYRYRVDGAGPFPDPASRHQPEGVHGPSEVVDPGAFPWSDGGWPGLAPEEAVIYELHVGTFSPDGTFAGVAERLPRLKELGVTAIELMPLADFAGERSWGYDGVDLFAPARRYGTPDDLRRLVDEAHRLGLAILLDVVYNHFGPVGNYTLSFSPLYLSEKHKSAWAQGVNLDGEGSAMVREFFIENALHWVHEYHADGLRLDATHALIDDSPRPFVAELVGRVRRSTPGRRVLLIAEDHRNMAAMLKPESGGGWGLDGVWADDFHHQVRRLLAGDDEGYYRDYLGSIPDLATTINQGWYYRGQHSIHLGESRGTDPEGLLPRQFVIALQNHDQIGNRALGERLHHEIDPAAYRAAVALLLCAPQTPLLFMGQEWSASTPFLYFTDHDEELGKVVTAGRRQEFRYFRAFADPEARERIPDPQAVSTFEASRLDWDEREREPHASILRLYRALLHVRRTEPALRSVERSSFEAVALDQDTLLLRREAGSGPSIVLVARLRGAGTVALDPSVGPCEVVFTSDDPPYAPDPSPPRLDRSGPTLAVHFARPSAVVLREEAADAAGTRLDRG